MTLSGRTVPSGYRQSGDRTVVHDVTDLTERSVFLFEDR